MHRLRLSKALSAVEKPTSENPYPFDHFSCWYKRASNGIILTSPHHHSSKRSQFLYQIQWLLSALSGVFLVNVKPNMFVLCFG